MKWIFSISKVNFDLQGHLKVIQRQFQDFFSLTLLFRSFPKPKFISNEIFENFSKYPLKMVKFLKFSFLDGVRTNITKKQKSGTIYDFIIS